MSIDELHRAIKELREDLDRIEYTIRSIESALEGKPVRGRPPKFLGNASEESDEDSVPTRPARRRPSAKPKPEPKSP